MSHDGKGRRFPLFGTDGVRGIVGHRPLVPEDVVRLGASYGRYLAENHRRATVIIGRDTRISGQMLQNALTAGILQSGATVVDAGVLSTPGIAFLMSKLGAEGCAVLSASHNPATENGIKFFETGGTKLSEASEDRITEFFGSDDPLTFRATTSGRVIDGLGLQELYLEDLVSEHEDSGFDRLTVVLDCANGASSRLAPEAFGRLGSRVVAIHCSPTGTNINVRCGSEHVRRYPQEIARVVRAYDAQFGVSFDGDADRVIFTTDDGHVVDGDHMLGLMAVHYSSQDRLLANAVVTTIMRNEGLCGFLAERGLRLLETGVGDKYVVDKLFELRKEISGKGDTIGLGGEQAGHVILLDEGHATGDGLRTALHFARAYEKSGAASLQEWASSLHKTPQVIASAYVGREPDHSRWPRAEWLNREARVMEASVGVTRASVRYSGTESLLRVMLEANGSQTTAGLASLAYDMCIAAQELAGTRGAFLEILNCESGGLLEPNRDHLSQQ